LLINLFGNQDPISANTGALADSAGYFGECFLPADCLCVMFENLIYRRHRGVWCCRGRCGNKPQVFSQSDSRIGFGLTAMTRIASDRISAAEVPAVEIKYH